MKIEFDPAKRDKTLLERDVDMARADEVLSGKTLTQRDDRKDYGEQRWISVSNDGFLSDISTAGWWYWPGQDGTAIIASSA